MGTGQSHRLGEGVVDGLGQVSEGALTAAGQAGATATALAGQRDEMATRILRLQKDIETTKALLANPVNVGGDGSENGAAVPWPLHAGPAAVEALEPTSRHKMEHKIKMEHTEAEAGAAAPLESSFFRNRDVKDIRGGAYDSAELSLLQQGEISQLGLMPPPPASTAHEPAAIEVAKKRSPHGLTPYNYPESLPLMAAISTAVFSDGKPNSAGGSMPYVWCGGGGFLQHTPTTWAARQRSPLLKYR